MANLNKKSCSKKGGNLKRVESGEGAKKKSFCLYSYSSINTFLLLPKSERYGFGKYNSVEVGRKNTLIIKKGFSEMN